MHSANKELISHPSHRCQYSNRNSPSRNSNSSNHNNYNGHNNHNNNLNSNYSCNQSPH